MQLTYGAGGITPEEIVKSLALTGQLEAVCADLAKRKEVVKKANHLGIEATTDDIQQLSDSFRAVQGLHSATETMSFLDKNGLTVDDFEQFCEEAVLANILIEHLADERAIAEYFVNHRSEFDLARVSVIMVASENMANEVVMQVTEDGEDFHQLARECSMDEQTKHAGGYVGAVSRSMLPPEAAAKVFNTHTGDLVGPFENEGMFQLLLVKDVRRAELDDETKEAIKERIFNEWVAQTLKGGITVQT